jgi:hypothetical protein
MAREVLDVSPLEGFQMLLRTAALLLIAAVALPAGWSSQTLGKSPEKKGSKGRESQSATRSLTGCIDEQDGGYVLVDDRNVQRIAVLEPGAFPKEGFAKYLGHKVTVRGESTSQNNQAAIRVRAIVNISDTCAPQQPD